MPKTVLERVLTAVETLAEPGGASRQAIVKCLKANGGEVSATALPAQPQKQPSVQAADRLGSHPLSAQPRSPFTTASLQLIFPAAT